MTDIDVVKKAKARLSAQKHLGNAKNLPEGCDGNCTCVGLALYDAARNAGVAQSGRDTLMRKFLVANKINEKAGPWMGLQLIGEWNDKPERTLAEAVAALDGLIDYLGTEPPA